ncbi:YitT family protein [Lacticaseibacillus daqingensis]|uniref:YitT family protein n=1 Tax=Lacticaseibacillus daqingensis TaxID=2486014 RepID=UPI000F7AC528|nr:YitT family protein [Lacticaseibacillus daqingensis]
MTNITQKNSHKEMTLDILWVALGNGITAFAYSWLLVKANIISGGVTASGMIMGRLTPLSTTFWTNTITLSCLLAALLLLGTRTFLNSIVSSVAYMIWFSVAQTFQPAIDLPLWLVLPLAGLAIGAGYFLCISHHASTAGLDVFALIVNKHWPNISVSFSLQLINITVLVIGAWQFGWQSFLAGLIFILLYTFTLNALQRWRSR